MSVRSKVGRLFSRRPKLSENTVGISKFERAVLRDWRKRAPMLAEEFGRTPKVEEFPPTKPEPEHVDALTWERLGEDLFGAYFAGDEPRVLAEAEVDPRFHLNRAVIDKHSRAPGFTAQRPRTRRDGFAAALATMAALGSIRKSFADELAEHARAQQDVTDAVDELADLDAQMAELRAEREPTLDDPAVVAAIDAQLRQLGKDKHAAIDGLADAVATQAAQATDLHAAARKAAQAAAGAAEKAVKGAAAMIGVGCGKEPGTPVHLAPDKAFELAEQYAASPVLQKVAEMMGRLEIGMAAKRRTMRRGGSEEIVDIERGDDLPHVLPHEKALLLHPVGRFDFYRRYIERGLMQFEMWSELELKRGPVIVVVDGSLSMKGARNIWARATALATVAIANREGRNAAAIEFSSPGQVRVVEFPKASGLDPVAAADFAGHFFAGGTSIFQGMTQAHGLIESEEPFHSADIVLITDGLDRWQPVDAELRDAFNSLGVQVHSISVGGQQPGDYLEKMSDDITSILDIDLGKANAANDAIAINLT